MLATIALVLVSFSLALVLGTIVCALRLAPVAPLRLAGTTFVEVFRNVPLLVLIFAMFLGLRRAGVEIGPVMAGVLSLALYSGSYVAEVLRSGVSAVGVGQAEAARALGMGGGETWRLILLPQAARTVIAPLGNLALSAIRNSAIVGASILAVPELMNRARYEQSRSFETVQTFFWAGVGFLLLTALATWAFAALERRFAIRR
jgi:His/Glu/Gln/Arg/opine family amino acid ABC transporter permease subunit